MVRCQAHSSYAIRYALGSKHGGRAICARARIPCHSHQGPSARQWPSQSDKPGASGQCRLGALELRTGLARHTGCAGNMARLTERHREPQGTRPRWILTAHQSEAANARSRRFLMLYLETPAASRPSPTTPWPDIASTGWSTLNPTDWQKDFGGMAPIGRDALSQALDSSTVSAAPSRRFLRATLQSASL